MDGLEFLAKVSLKPSDPYSVIILTGHGDDAAVKECYDAGVSNFLRKPFKLDEIRGAVKNAMAVKQLTSHLDNLVRERNAELEECGREIIRSNLEWKQQLAQAEAQIHRFHELSLEINALAEKARSEQISDLEAIMTMIGDISLYRILVE